MKWTQRHRPWLGVLILAGSLIAAWLMWQANQEQRHDPVILAAARRYQMDPALIKAVIWRESRFHEQAHGTQGEVGLMQLREDAAREWARAEGMTNFEHAQMLHPLHNALAGTWYLRKQLRRFAAADDPTPYALAAYNAGPANARKWSQGAAATNSARFMQAIAFPGTRAYVEAVLQRQRVYARQFAVVARQ